MKFIDLFVKTKLNQPIMLKDSKRDLTIVCLDDAGVDVFADYFDKDISLVTTEDDFLVIYVKDRA